MPILIVVVATIMVGGAIIQVQLTVHFWDTFAAPNPQIKALVVGVAICMALLEFFLLALSAELRRHNLPQWAGRVMFIFWFTFVGNFLSDYSAFVSLTAGDRDARAQIAQVYQMDQDRLAQLDRDIAALQAQLAASEMNMPSAALAASLSAQEEIAARYVAQQQEVPSVTLRRIARLDSARITAERLESLQAERQQAADALRSRDAVPHAVHPQFEAISGLLFNWVSAEQVRSFLPVILVIAFKSAVIWIYGALFALMALYWNQRAAYQGGDGGQYEGGETPANDLNDDGLTARNDAAEERATPPPPAELSGGRQSAPLQTDDDDVINQINDIYDQDDRDGTRS